MKQLLAVTLGVLIFYVSAASESQGSRPFQAEDIFRLEYADNPRISPNGEKVVYLRKTNDIMTDRARRDIWCIELESMNQYPLFSDRHNRSVPVWDRRSERIAFVSNASGENHIYVHLLKENRTLQVVRVPDRVRNLEWSPDGSWIAFNMDVPAPTRNAFTQNIKRPNRPEGARWSARPVVIDRARYQSDGRGMLPSSYSQIFIVSAEGGAKRQLTFAQEDHQSNLAWSKDSSRIIYSARTGEDWELSLRESNLHAIDILSGDIERLTFLDGSQTHPKISPSGRQVAFLNASGDTVAYRHTELAVLDLDSGSIVEIPNLIDRSIRSAEWDAEGERFVIMYDDRGHRKLGYLSWDGELTEIVGDVSGARLGRPYLSGEFSVSDNGLITYTQGDAHKPADVALVRDGARQPLTQLNRNFLDFIDLGEIHEFVYDSALDGEQIHGWYLTPPGFDPEMKYPLILEIHGGPHLAYGPHFSAEHQLMAARGYVVFFNNYRGSSSYGEHFAMLLQNKYNSVDDFTDHMSGIDAMIGKGFIDEEQLFVTGGSAGGAATAYAVGLTDRFRAAAAVNPVINWTSKVLTSDSYLSQIPNQFPGLPWDEHEHYWQRSALSLVGNVSTPTMVMAGDADRRTPISEAEQYYQALKLRGIDTALVRVPGASHAISSRPSRMIAKVEHVLAWFKTHGGR
ncbi:MAG: S9 family peptidase [Opitutales bacterium]|nr:S9 family peptidase [Opitutales bacterium]